MVLAERYSVKYLDQYLTSLRNETVPKHRGVNSKNSKRQKSEGTLARRARHLADSYLKYVREITNFFVKEIRENCYFAHKNV